MVAWGPPTYRSGRSRFFSSVCRTPVPQQERSPEGGGGRTFPAQRQPRRTQRPGFSPRGRLFLGPSPPVHSPQRDFPGGRSKERDEVGRCRSGRRERRRLRARSRAGAQQPDGGAERQGQGGRLRRGRAVSGDRLQPAVGSAGGGARPEGAVLLAPELAPPPRLCTRALVPPAAALCVKLFLETTPGRGSEGTQARSSPRQGRPRSRRHRHREDEAVERDRCPPPPRARTRRSLARSGRGALTLTARGRAFVAGPSRVRRTGLPPRHGFPRRSALLELRRVLLWRVWIVFFLLGEDPAASRRLPPAAGSAAPRLPSGSPGWSGTPFSAPSACSALGTEAAWARPPLGGVSSEVARPAPTQEGGRAAARGTRRRRGGPAPRVAPSVRARSRCGPLSANARLALCASAALPAGAVSGAEPRRRVAGSPGARAPRGGAEAAAGGDSPAGRDGLPAPVIELLQPKYHCKEKAEIICAEVQVKLSKECFHPYSTCSIDLRTARWEEAIQETKGGAANRKLAEECYFLWKSTYLQHMILAKDVKTMLAELRKELRQLLLMNGNRQTQREKIEACACQSYLNTVVIGGEQREKPAPSIFYYCCNLRVQPGDCAMVGDILGGLNAGLKATVRINKNGMVPLKSSPVLHYVVSSVLELPALL
ncbi:PREDICTED: uncharacterized protein LOC105824058 [Propithecus coquereli]|uniref:uncharacterized protein LOC105824058 n=1 Tax=Propithecus coquereli TaxID=379532 RepID=UPI00063EEDAA|nr:PREDICTED: uncharacterized protein LOC105824058 [Propithecus coquereli]